MGYSLQIVLMLVAVSVAVFYSGKGFLIRRKLTEIVHGKPGCAPVPDLGNVTIHYFAGRGRAEAIRMLLEIASVPYSDISFTSDTWPAHKPKGIESGLYTFGQVPAIETTTGMKLTQSHAILHYVGRATGTECDCEDLHMCEVIALGVEDMRKLYFKMLYDPGFSLQARQEYLTQTLPMWLGHFEKLAPPLTQQETPYFASHRLTWVDVLVFDIIETNIEFSEYDFKAKNIIQVKVLEKFPKLNTFYKNMLKISELYEFVKSGNRFPYKVPNMPVDLSPPTAKE